MICNKCDIDKTISNFRIKKTPSNPKYRSKVCNQCHNKYMRKLRRKNISYVKSNREKAMSSYLRRKFGITKLERDILNKKQNGKCAICKNKCKSGRYLAIDHCHKTDKIRGLLCSKCNVGLGMFEDNILLLNSAIKYLKIYE